MLGQVGGHIKAYTYNLTSGTAFRVVGDMTQDPQARAHPANEVVSMIASEEDPVTRLALM